MSIKELEKKRDDLIKKQIKEYRTRGNTQRSQEMFVETQALEAQIEKERKKWEEH